jgi:3',5'-cyclic AMP phosphodiesterase CpdA
MRVRAHYVVLTLVVLAVMATLAEQYAAKLAATATASGIPGWSASATPTTTATPTTSPRPTITLIPTATPDNVPDVVFAAGDLADCPDALPEVAELARSLRGPILALGDIVHPGGSPEEYADCLDPVWGDLKDRMWPVPGNHDYQTPGAAGYYRYFGPAAGHPTEGFYSFDVGWWHVIAINSFCSAIGGCRAGSPQMEWLLADLASNPSRCTLAYWHHPRYTSGSGASPRRTAYLWQVLYGQGVDVVLNGHDHHYERFAPLSAAGEPDPDRGVRQFVVGTGGANLTRRVRAAPHSELWTRDFHGLLELTLYRARYEWRFLAAPAGEVIDAGRGICH